MTAMIGTGVRIGGGFAAIFTALICPVVSGQTSVEPPAVSPGARSLGLGGAFVAVADDATAAWTNPSGLMQLVRPEISADGRGWSEDRDAVASNQSNLGFLSFVLPRQAWSLALYGQTLSSLEFPDQLSTGGGEPVPLSSLVIANVGVSAAVRLSDAVSIGFGVTAFAGAFTEGLVGSPSSYPFFEDEVQHELGATAGVLWNLDESWAIGAAARTGADFRFSSGGRAVFPDIVSAGARWSSAGGHATVAAELEHLSGIENRVRPHLGAEWVFLESRPLIGVRVGLWHDPEGGSGAIGSDAGPTIDDSVVHGSVGIGFAWRKFQLDVAADVSERTTITSLSGIFTFGR
jgi:hypothetical protein